MPDPFELLAVVRHWIRLADDDVLNASNTLKLGKKCPVGTVCFHSQQCVEKYLKALLALRGIRFPMTHDIALLVALLPEQPQCPMEPSVRTRMTRYATVTRYPGDYANPTLAEAREAVRIARRARSWCRRLLPGAALRPAADSSGK